MATSGSTWGLFMVCCVGDKAVLEMETECFQSIHSLSICLSAPNFSTYYGKQIYLTTGEMCK